MFSELSEALVFNIDYLLNYDGVRVVAKARIRLLMLLTSNSLILNFSLVMNLYNYAPKFSYSACVCLCMITYADKLYL